MHKKAELIDDQHGNNMTLMRWLHSLRLFRLVGVLVCLCAVFANLLKRKWYKGTFVLFLLVLSINDDQCHLNRFWEESGETCVILDFGICNKVLLNKIKYLTRAVVKSTENGKPFDGPFLLWLDIRHTCKFNDTLYKKIHSFFFDDIQSHSCKYWVSLWQKKFSTNFHPSFTLPQYNPFIKPGVTKRIFSHFSWLLNYAKPNGKDKQDLFIGTLAKIR